MSLATVKAHVSQLLTKLGVANRVQIALLVHDRPPGGNSKTGEQARGEVNALCCRVLGRGST